LRVAELVSGLSLVTDLGMGQPMEHAMTTCLLAMRAGSELGLDDSTLSDVYYLALLRFIGCTADASEFAAAVGGDDVGQRAALAPVINGSTGEFMRHMLRNIGAGAPPLSRVRLLASAMADGGKSAERGVREHCHVAQMLAPRLGINPAVAEHVGLTFEFWNGKGMPGDLEGDAIPMGCRVVAVARDAEVLFRLGGWDLGRETLTRRRGAAYDPAVTDVFLASGERWLQDVREQTTWDAVLAAEPGRPLTIAASRLDDVLTAFADLADLKSPYAARHSRAVAELAETAARSAGMRDDEASDVRRAALLHDVGKVGVPNGILDGRGPLTPAEWERVRMHSYLTERVLSYVPALRGLAALAGSHHERLDGSGYHRGLSGGALTAASRVLAAANTYEALGQDRPYRPAVGRPGRERELLRQAEEGRLDRVAVRCVLEAAGHAPRRGRGEWPAGLTDREVEVLRLVARGQSNRAIAQELTISQKTVGRHVENIYGKCHVSGRATAAVFAMEHGLL
jgi:HD-GYP domain-containing protein (c-di-GMP phosphodiesterase class II)